MNGHEDLYTKLSLSTITFLFNSIEEIDDLPSDCGELEQGTSSTAVVLVNVALIPTPVAGSGARESIVPPRPAQRILLFLHGLDQSSLFDPGSPPYSLTFGLSRGGQTTGEFYFLDVPAGLYTLEFDIELVTDALAGCQRRRSLMPRLLQQNTFASGSVNIGDHVVTIEKINVPNSGQCNPIEIGDFEPLPNFPYYGDSM
jgi:hypothetical protein